MTTPSTPSAPPQTVDVLESKEAVVRAACRFSDCADEFFGDLTVCGEYIGALWEAVDRLKRAEDYALSLTNTEYGVQS